MTDEIIPSLHDYAEPALDRAFAAVLDEARCEAEDAHFDKEAFRLRWLGHKQGRLKLIGDARLNSAPDEARKLIGQRFNSLKEQIDRRQWITEYYCPIPRPSDDRCSADCPSYTKPMLKRRRVF